MQKGFLISSLAAILFLSGCSKDSGCKAVSPATEDGVMVAFNAAKRLTATKHSSGMYYQIVTPGSSTHPVSTSRVYVKYTGMKLDNVVFDQQLNAALTGFSLGGLIEGWKIGIPLLGKGGKILMTIPSSMAYGCQGSGTSIPANSPLYFEVELVDFL